MTILVSSSAFLLTKYHVTLLKSLPEPLHAYDPAAAPLNEGQKIGKHSGEASVSDLSSTFHSLSSVFMPLAAHLPTPTATLQVSVCGLSLVADELLVNIAVTSAGLQLKRLSIFICVDNPFGTTSSAPAAVSVSTVPSCQ